MFESPYYTKSKYYTKKYILAKNIPKNYDEGKEGIMKITQIRNATLWIEYGGIKFLIDPWLGPKEYMPGFEGAIHSEVRQPHTNLPFPVEEVVLADAVILTHVHPDHWDSYAQQALRKDIEFLVQSEADKQYIEAQGFTRVRVLGTEGLSIGEVNLYKTPGQHGERAKIEPVCRQQGLPYDAMGVVLKAPGEKTLYVAGDTIFCDEVKQTLQSYQPEVIIVNACAARVASGDRLIMDANDVEQTALHAPGAVLIASHMDEVSHLSLTRQQLRDFITRKKMSQVKIPENGESLEF